jgi:hypothetical protein
MERLVNNLPAMSYEADLGSLSGLLVTRGFIAGVGIA